MKRSVAIAAVLILAAATVGLLFFGPSERNCKKQIDKAITVMLAAEDMEEAASDFRRRDFWQCAMLTDAEKKKAVEEAFDARMGDILLRGLTDYVAP